MGYGEESRLFLALAAPLEKRGHPVFQIATLPAHLADEGSKQSLSRADMELVYTRPAEDAAGEP